METTIQVMKSVDHGIPMHPNVRELCHQYEALWWSCDSSLPDLGRIYPAKEKRSRESQLSSSIDLLISELERLSHSPENHEQIENSLVVLLSNFARTTFDLEDRHLAAVISTGIVDATREFLRKAKMFDPEISFQNVYQASRNAWTMNLLQLFWGIPVAVTPAVLGYSLLYPYTDNYLDDPHITTGEKQSFSHRFLKRLEGENVNPQNIEESNIFRCVGLIEDQYDRWGFPEVYECLLAIYWAQTKSIRLLNPKASPYDLDILGLSLEKGGASVLTDGYLVAGRLTSNQQQMAFHYGSFTQLMDDLEDLNEDRSRGLMSIFTQTASHWPLDSITTRAFHYGLKMLEKLEEFGNSDLNDLYELLHMAIIPLLIDSVSQAGRFYTPGYLRELEAHFPFRFAFLKKQRKKTDKKISNNRKVLDALLKNLV